MSMSVFFINAFYCYHLCAVSAIYPSLFEFNKTKQLWFLHDDMVSTACLPYPEEFIINIYNLN